MAWLARLGTYWDEAKAVVMTLLKDPATMTRVATRLGSAATPGAILRAARDNPMTTALLLAELGPEAGELIAKFRELHPEAAALVDQFQMKIDPVDSETNLSDVSKYMDEFALIDEAVDLFGSLERVMMIRNLMKLSDEHFKLRMQIAELGYKR